MYKALHSWLQGCKPIRLKLLTCVVCLALISFWMLCVHHPLNCLIERTQQAIKHINEQQRMDHEAQLGCAHLEKSIDHIKSQLAHRTKLLPQESQLSIFNIINHANSCNIALQHCSVESESD